jgi:hypothetical protein
MAGRPKSDNPKQHLTLRLPPELLGALEHHIERLKLQAPWTSPTKTDAARDLIRRGLEAVQAEEGKTKTRKR